ncbi:hypothetical protein AOL_s00097g300 [Orbilia oligospora ATCC 24927]|uniref:DUF7587 domain-containing protein n=1 Tax=Arthrobotrys oligospora (strain ATCC 24927 / CBS 115.81 / DSM 1491) TaxID=756982 RepID=G1XIX3_ARTOA|nr:hypothetical protein AOL_s00097g300 [Orbilia oligospora ATCC 24927]EGX46874.1 hypothetical protein AOL_s00097g300 [Orbilia oligospora ATCC 24927]
MARRYENAASTYGPSSSRSRSDRLPDFRLQARSRNLPKYLYRVHSDESITEYTSADGFLSASDETIDLRGSEFMRTLSDHLTWGSKSPSPFISTYANESHAISWAKLFLQKPGREHDEVQIMRINTQKIRGDSNERKPIISVREVVIGMREKNVEVLPPERNDNQIRDEYLFLYQIPRGAIDNIRDYSLDMLKPQPKKGESSRRWRGQAHQESSREPDSYPDRGRGGQGNSRHTLSVTEAPRGYIHGDLPRNTDFHNTRSPPPTERREPRRSIRDSRVSDVWRPETESTIVRTVGPPQDPFITSGETRVDYSHRGVATPAPGPGPNNYTYTPHPKAQVAPFPSSSQFNQPYGHNPQYWDHNPNGYQHHQNPNYAPTPGFGTQNLTPQARATQNTAAISRTAPNPRVSNPAKHSRNQSPGPTSRGIYMTPAGKERGGVEHQQNQLLSSSRPVKASRLSRMFNKLRRSD